MRIVTGPIELEPNNFSSYNSFDAVVSLNSGEIQALVREAEPPRHDEIIGKRLRDPEKQKDLRLRMRSIATILQSEAGRYSDEEEFALPNFALVAGSGYREADKVTIFEEEPPEEEEEEETQNEEEEDSEEEEESTEEDDAEDEKVVEYKPPSHSGSQPDYGFSICLGESNTELQVDLDYRGAVSDKHNYLLIVNQASGSDETCEEPIKDEELEILALSPEGDIPSYVPDPEDHRAIVVPSLALQGKFSIELGDEIENTEGISIKMYKKPSEKAKVREEGSVEVRPAPKTEEVAKGEAEEEIKKVDASKAKPPTEEELLGVEDKPATEDRAEDANQKESGAEKDEASSDESAAGETADTVVPESDLSAGEDLDDDLEDALDLDDDLDMDDDFDLEELDEPAEAEVEHNIAAGEDTNKIQEDLDEEVGIVVEEI